MQLSLGVHEVGSALDLSDLLDIDGTFAGASTRRFYWSSPGRSVEIAGIGEVWRAATRGPGRLVRLAEAARRVGEHQRTGRARISQSSDPSRDLANLVFVGGFAFGAQLGRGWRGFAPAELWVPRYTLMKDARGLRLISARPMDGNNLAIRADQEGQAYAVLAALGAIGNPSQPRRPTAEEALHTIPRRDRTRVDDLARRRAAAAIESIRRGEATKIVVAVPEARTMGTGTASLSMGALIARLRRLEPEAYHYVVSPRPDRLWFGATPEQLVAVSGQQVRTMALAGTTARGATPEDDERLGAALLASDKDRREHQAVVEMVAGSLPGTLDPVPATPGIRRLATVQHLQTPIGSRLEEPGNLLAIAGRLHPTPALGGSPRGAALEAIRRIEGDQRGWYGGGVGWMNGLGDGELAVAIRGLRLTGDVATAFAGAGIVAGSEAGREAAEIRRKLDGIWRLAEP